MEDSEHVLLTFISSSHCWFAEMRTSHSIVDIYFLPEQSLVYQTLTAAVATAVGARRGRRSAGKLARCQSIEDIDIIHLISSCLHTSSTYVLSLHKTIADISSFLLQSFRFQCTATALTTARAATREDRTARAASRTTARTSASGELYLSCVTT